jgi:hypothetical protein
MRLKVEQHNLLPNNHPLLTSGARLFTTDEEKLGLKISRKAKEFLRVDKPNGDPLFMLVKDAIPEDVWRPAYEILRTVSGSLANRPDIIGQQLRTPQFRKDGTLGNYNVASPELVDEFGGNADLLGYYRYKNPAPGVPDCGPTAWTEGETDLLLGCMKFIRAVDEVYKLWMPTEYGKQMQVVRKIPQNWRMYDTAFTTLYVLKNAPTAVHKDKADAFGTFGCMASLGDFTGNELVFPQYLVGADYRPGDVILADVHQWHTNLPLLSGERVSCVFFVREGMNECLVSDVPPRWRSSRTS